MKFLRIAIAVPIAILASSSLGLAQIGCVHSPENPSVILGLTAGAVIGLPFLVARLKSRIRK